MRCLLLRRRWSTLRLLYVDPLGDHDTQNKHPTPASSHINKQIGISLRPSSPLICNFQVENESRAQLPSRQGASPEQTSNLEESIYKLSAQVSTISRNQKYFRTRENRNFSTVRSTERRIFNFSVIEGLMMVSMAALQVFVVRFFFQGARKGTYLPERNSVTLLVNLY